MLNLIAIKPWQILLFLIYVLCMTDIQAAPGDIVILRDVPHQRFDGIRHTGQPTIINPSPVRETNALVQTLTQGLGITELSDQQFSNVTSGVGAILIPNNTTALTQDIGQAIKNQSSGSVNQLSPVHSVTGGLGKSIGGSVGGITKGIGNDVRNALSGLPGLTGAAK